MAWEHCLKLSYTKHRFVPITGVLAKSVDWRQVGELDWNVLPLTHCAGSVCPSWVCLKDKACGKRHCQALMGGTGASSYPKFTEVLREREAAGDKERRCFAPGL